MAFFHGSYGWLDTVTPIPALPKNTTLSSKSSESVVFPNEVELSISPELGITSNSIVSIGECVITKEEKKYPVIFVLGKELYVLYDPRIGLFQVPPDELTFEECYFSSLIDYYKKKELCKPIENIEEERTVRDDCEADLEKSTPVERHKKEFEDFKPIENIKEERIMQDDCEADLEKSTPVERHEKEFEDFKQQIIMNLHELTVRVKLCSEYTEGIVEIKLRKLQNNTTQAVIEEEEQNRNKISNMIQQRHCGMITVWMKRIIWLEKKGMREDVIFEELMLSLTINFYDYIVITEYFPLFLRSLLPEIYDLRNDIRENLRKLLDRQEQERYISGDTV
jgi:hypothetical protein